ncbi:MAG: prolipoprotein diacylglyceryl transferase [Thermodesulfobacteriota bacterium]|nr:prolipoprotein diacylglyceryl transferase [Thermodesulfobacteriota bacterium]
MYPVIQVGNLSTYYMMMLSGIVAGWIAFVFSEDVFWTRPGVFGKSVVIVRLSIGYLAVVILCIQGANYFHFLFDNIPPHVAHTLTWRDILFTHPLKTTKVLYGAVFFYPLGIAIAALVAGARWTSMLNRKAFILFIVLGSARIGCFLNGCCHGIVSYKFGIRFPSGSVAASEHWRRGLTRGFLPPASLPVIPTQLISAIFLLGLAVFAFRHYRKGKKHTFVKSVLAYAVFRFLIEFIRDDVDRAYWAGVSTSQWISVFLFAAIGLWAFKRKYRRG